MLRNPIYMGEFVWERIGHGSSCPGLAPCCQRRGKA